MMMDITARRVLNDVRRMVPGRFDVRAASPATHPYVAWADYDRARQALQAAGFRHLGDVDVVSFDLGGGPMRPTPMRLMVNGDGTVLAAFYRPALRWTLTGILARLNGHGRGVLDLTTQYDDGVLLETTSADAAAVCTQPVFVQRETLPRDTAIPDLLERHFLRMHRYATLTRPGADAVPARTLDEVVAAAAAMERRKLEYRRSIGWITRQELERLARTTAVDVNQLEAAVRRVTARPEWSEPATPVHA